MSDFAQLIEKLTPDIYQRLKTAVEIGKWPDGRKVTPEQRALSLQAVIAYEIEQNFPKEERTGFVNTKGSECHADDDAPQPLKWQ